MKIAIEGQRLFRNKKHGMDIVALELIKNLQKIDLENEYHIFVKDDIDNGCLNLTGNFHLHVLPSHPYPIWEQITLPNAVSKINADILHCTSNTAPIFSPCPLVITLHDIIYLEKNPLISGSYYQRFGNVYRRFVVPPVAHKAESVMTVSEFEKGTITNRLPKLKDKLKVVYNGVGSHFNDHIEVEIQNEVKNRYKLPDDFILFLGNTAPKKNLEAVICAFDEYKRKVHSTTKLVIVDFSLGNLEIVLRKNNIDQAILNDIVLAGYVKNADLPSFYTLAKLFLYPSLRESFGIPILEAMACGTPVITSNTSSMPEIAEGAAILIDPFDYKSITEAIISIMDNAEVYEKLKQEGIIRAQKFSWLQTAKETLAIYNSMRKRS